MAPPGELLVGHGEYPAPVKEWPGGYAYGGGGAAAAHTAVVTEVSCGDRCTVAVLASGAVCTFGHGEHLLLLRFTLTF